MISKTSFLEMSEVIILSGIHLFNGYCFYIVGFKLLTKQSYFVENPLILILRYLFFESVKQVTNFQCLKPVQIQTLDRVQARNH